MLFTDDNQGVKNGHNEECGGNGTIPMVADFCAGKEHVLNAVIDGSDDNKMEAYNDERANRKVDDDV